MTTKTIDESPHLMSSDSFHLPADDSDATEELPVDQTSSKRSHDDDDNDENGVDTAPKRAKSSSEPVSTVHVGDWTGSPFGFGTLAISVLYPDASKRPSPKAATKMIHQLLDAGCRFFDTAGMSICFIESFVNLATCFRHVLHRCL